MSDPQTAPLLNLRASYPLAAACAITDYSKPSLYRFASEGRLRLTRIGGRTYVDGAELVRFMAAQTRPFVPGERVIANAGRRRVAAK